MSGLDCVTSTPLYFFSRVSVAVEFPHSKQRTMHSTGTRQWKENAGVRFILFGHFISRARFHWPVSQLLASRAKDVAQSGFCVSRSCLFVALRFRMNLAKLSLEDSFVVEHSTLAGTQLAPGWHSAQDGDHFDRSDVYRSSSPKSGQKYACGRGTFRKPTVDSTGRDSPAKSG